MTSNNLKKINLLISENIEFINKTKTEKFKDFWIMDILLKNALLNIVIKENITVEINNSMHQYLLDFAKNEKSFETFDEFKTFFQSLINGIKEQANNIYAIFEGEEYICEIEVTSVDADRQMGPETLYSVIFNDNDGNEVIALEISEYPMGAFSIFERNPKVEIDEDKVLKYFYYNDADYEDY